MVFEESVKLKVTRRRPGHEKQLGLRGQGADGGDVVVVICLALGGHRRPFWAAGGSHKMTTEKPKRALCVEFGLEPRSQLIHEKIPK